jgi:hypothetical protein
LQQAAISGFGLHPAAMPTTSATRRSAQAGCPNERKKTQSNRENKGPRIGAAILKVQFRVTFLGGFRPMD